MNIINIYIIRYLQYIHLFAITFPKQVQLGFLMFFVVVVELVGEQISVNCLKQHVLHVKA